LAKDLDMTTEQVFSEDKKTKKKDTELVQKKMSFMYTDWYRNKQLVQAAGGAK
jgi:hypothetical protein